MRDHVGTQKQQQKQQKQQQQQQQQKQQKKQQQQQQHEPWTNDYYFIWKIICVRNKLCQKWYLLKY